MTQARIRIAIVGPGAIGGTLAAWLATNPTNDVSLCVRTRFEELRLTTPDGDVLASRPRIFTDPADASPVDWVLTVTKAYDTEGASRWLRALVGPSTRVVVVQNGVEHMRRFAGLVPSERTLPSIVDIPAERSAPGVIRQRRFGLVVVPDGALARDFAKLFEGTKITPTLSADFRSAIWKKLVWNSGGAINAILGKPSGVMRQDDVAELVKAVAREAIAVGRAEGATLDDELPNEVVQRYRESPVDSVNSILADRLAGRPMELDARNGVIVRLGEQHGIATPLNRMAVTLLSNMAR